MQFAKLVYLKDVCAQKTEQGFCSNLANVETKLRCSLLVWVSSTGTRVKTNQGLW